MLDCVIPLKSTNLTENICGDILESNSYIHVASIKAQSSAICRHINVSVTVKEFCNALLSVKLNEEMFAVWQLGWLSMWHWTLSL